MYTQKLYGANKHYHMYERSQQFLGQYFRFLQSNLSVELACLVSIVNCVIIAYFQIMIQIIR